MPFLLLLFCVRTRSYASRLTELTVFVDPGSSELPPSANQATPAASAARARAVRLLREAASSAPAAASGMMSSGELAFAVEKAAVEAFGVGQPRYFEFVARFSLLLKVSESKAYHHRS